MDTARAHEWLGGEPADFAAVQRSFDGMPLDEYMADGGRYRRRLHGVFGAPRGGPAHRLPQRPHFQAKQYNALNGDVPRHFAPIAPATSDGATVQTLLRAALEVFEPLTPEARHWDIEAHQFRIEASERSHGMPTPEGVHRDGVDWVLVLLVARCNVASGTTTIHQPDGTLLGSFTLTTPGEVVLLDDTRVFHGVTPVTPVDARLPAYRDVLVLTFRGLRSLPFPP